MSAGPAKKQTTSCLAAVSVEAHDVIIFKYRPAPRVAGTHSKRNLVELDGYHAGNFLAARRSDGCIAQSRTGIEDS